MLHCLPLLDTKLESMAGFEAVVNNLDRLGLIKLLRRAFFSKMVQSR